MKLEKNSELISLTDCTEHGLFKIAMEICRMSGTTIKQLHFSNDELWGLKIISGDTIETAYGTYIVRVNAVGCTNILQLDGDGFSIIHLDMEDFNVVSDEDEVSTESYELNFKSDYQNTSQCINDIKHGKQNIDIFVESPS